MTTTCAICSHAFDARTSYGICASCYTKDNLREWDRLQSARDYALRLHVPVSLSLIEWLSIVSDFRGLCAYCCVYSFTTIEMVHPMLGLTPVNVVPVCRACHEHKKYGFDDAIDRVQTYLRGERTD